MHDIPQSVLDAYDLGPIDSVERVSDGLIHQTYKISSMAGDFILQRLHEVLSSQEIAQDFLAVTEHLRDKDFMAPEAVLTKDGEVLVHDGEYNWRMQTFIDGKVYETVDDPAVVRGAASMYARFHKAMDDIEHTFVSELKLHETRKIYDEFKATVEGVTDDFGAREEIDFLLEELPKQFLPEDLPLRVIHGDPKITNILFDDDGNAMTVIDLDTCNHLTVLADLGDAFRSWCGGKEDDPNNAFNVELFMAGWDGYKEGAGDFITQQEKDLVGQAIGCITLELAARFLKDVFDDSYFGFDESRYASRRGHNLARARGQIALFKDLQSKLDQLG